MTITAKMVAELRERTGAGMMDCKKALVEAQGNIEVAIENMRKSGQAKAAKKAGRITAEGLILIASSSSTHSAMMVEINCETDFVARGDDFVKFAHKSIEKGLSAGVNNVADFLNLTLDGEHTIETSKNELIAKIGENIQIRRIVHFDSKEDHIAHYLHGTRIGVLVQLKGGSAELAKDIAMHIAASNPHAIAASDVDPEIIAKEKAIYEAQVLESGKPAEMAEKIIQGKINKFLNEISLLGQPFVKNPDRVVGQLLQEAKAEVIQFTRFELGEGIEKQTANFVEEVMAQAKKS